MNLNVIELTRQLVRIPSLNPMGRTLLGPEFLETRLTDFLQQLADSLGFPWERHPVMPGRDNLLVGLPMADNSPTTPLILLEVHQDTVPIDGMTIDPFAAELREGRIWGRGACDVKGGMAAMWCTIERLAHTLRTSDARSLGANIVLACTVNEENGFDGIRHVSQLWTTGQSTLLPRAPHLAIVAEPTELDVVVAHKGTVRWRCRTVGRAAHSSNPKAGDNAIYRMQPVLAALEAYAAAGLPPAPEHPLLGHSTLSVGTIHGGISVNTVPDECTIEIDRRLLPGESSEAAWQHACDYVANVTSSDAVRQDAPFLRSPGLSADRNGALADQLSEIIRKHGFAGKQIGVPFGTDAGVVSAAGVPTVVFGPGSIQQAHTHDEWIATDSLEAATDILTDFCQSLARTK